MVVKINCNEQQVTKVNKVQQGGPILYVEKDKPGQFLIMRKELPRTHGNYRQASFHHAHMIRVRYFGNMWVDRFLGAVLTWTSLPHMINTSCKHLQLQKKN